MNASLKDSSLRSGQYTSMPGFPPKKLSHVTELSPKDDQIKSDTPSESFNIVIDDKGNNFFLTQIAICSETSAKPINNKKSN